MKKLALSVIIVGGLITLIFIVRAKINGTVKNNERITESINTEDWWDSAQNFNPNPDWVLDAEIPDNYVPVPGKTETYMIIDENGNITGYRYREKNDDGEWIWKDIKDSIPEEYEPVIGKKDIYRKKNEDNSYTYYKYIRNDDGSYAFVECDENGSYIEIPSGAEVPSNYKLITRNEKSNIYAVYNENGVIVSYMERYIDENGKYCWRKTSKPAEKPTEAPTIKPTIAPTIKPTEPSTPVPTKPAVKPTEAPTEKPTDNDKNGTRTEIKTQTTTEIKGNYLITYTTKITYTYDKDGNLLSTKTEGPIETSKQLITDDDILVPDKSLICKTLSEELIRVSSKVSYDEEIANKVLLSLNEDRESAGLQPLKMDKSSSLYKIAQIKAADMAIYNHSDFDSPMYGTILDISSKFSVNISQSSETLWKTTDKTAKEINSRFQATQSTRNNRMSSTYTNIGIAVVNKNGFMYIYECYS